MGLTDADLIVNLKADAIAYQNMLSLACEERYALEIDRDHYRFTTRALCVLVVVMLWPCLLLI